MTSPAPAARPYRSKTAAVWIAFVGGALGLHRFYLHGLRDPVGWLFAPLSALGLIGVQRVLRFGVDDHLSWLLIPCLGVTLTAGCASAIFYGLTPDERWNARHAPGAPQHRMHGGTVLGIVAALIVGGIVLMSTIASTAQHWFEWQVEQRDAAPAQPRNMK